jgi:hypothetical protein
MAVRRACHLGRVRLRGDPEVLQLGDMVESRLLVASPVERRAAWMADSAESKAVRLLGATRRAQSPEAVASQGLRVSMNAKERRAGELYLADPSVAMSEWLRKSLLA